MIYVFLWVLFIPALYLVYYSHLTNFDVINKLTDDFSVHSRKKEAFLVAITSPVGLVVVLAGGFRNMLVDILNSDSVENPFLLFPLHNPWKDS